MRICSLLPRLPGSHGRLISLCLVTSGGLLVTGCGPKPAPPYVRAYADDPKQAHCFDGVPHLAGSKPWIMGGTCCCTPTDDLMTKLHADGFCTDLDTEGLKTLYREKGIRLATEHSGCNNLCKEGPHVTRGGKCMAPPRPGTRNYQEVVTGVVFVPASQPAGQ